MKLILTLICVLALFSCKPEVQNDKKTLNKIFASNNYHINVQTCGCFGCGTYSYDVNVKNEKVTIANSSGKQKIEVSRDSIESFKKFMSERIGKNISRGLCTSKYIFKVETNNLAITFTDEGCHEWDILNKIIPLESIPNSFEE
ncbi:hypothetical protein [Winogradskyella sp. A3E31]|uniref:hypothetical protein n=1 Tax=Winogradskyella sp. A3E31 TaxID=3349637 RepID=UPI00398AA871